MYWRVISATGMSRMSMFCLRIRYSSRSRGPSKASRKTSRASGGMYRSWGSSVTASPYTSASGSCSGVACTSVGEALMASGDFQEGRGIAAADADHLRPLAGQVDHRGGLEAAVAAVDDQVHMVFQQPAHVVGVAQRQLLAGHDQAHRHQRRIQLAQQRLGD